MFLGILKINIKTIIPFGLTIALCGVIAKGGGSREVFVFFVGLAIGLSAWMGANERNWFTLTKCGASVFLLMLNWSIVHLFGFWVLLLYLPTGNLRDKSKWSCLSSAMLIVWIVQSASFVKLSIIPIVSIPIFISSAIIIYFMPRWVHIIFAACCIFISLFDISMIQRKTRIEMSHDPMVENCYTQSEAITHLLSANIVAPGHVSGDVGISSLFFDKGPNKASKRIFLVEHGQKPSSDHKIIAGGEVSQWQPWSSNQLFGDQYLLTAIAMDGQWNSNVGGRLHPNGKLILASSRHPDFWLFEPLVVECGQDIYIQDSDPFVDRLVPYQENAIIELVRGCVEYRVLNIIMVIASLLPYCFSAISLFVIIILSLLLLSKFPVKGDVRLVGRIESPHEPSRISGVLRSLSDAGYPMLRGTSGCHILVVDENSKALVKASETFILAGPGSTVSIPSCKIKVSDIPLGNVDDVVDARELLIDGKVVGPIYSIHGITIIGTGSPAKQEWKKWLH